MSTREMDPKSAWALGEFRDSRMQLVLIDKDGIELKLGGDASADAHGGEEESIAPATHIAHQGERLTGRLLVEFDGDSDSGDSGEKHSRWRHFASELKVELEIMTQAAAATTNDAAISSEEPSLWRDYEGRENARDRGVLMRTSRSVRLQPASAAMNDRGLAFTYALDIEVQVPIDFLGQRVVLEALVSPASRSQLEDTAAAAAGIRPDASSDAASAGGSQGGRRAGVSDGNFTHRLDNLFALSRIPAVRVPVKRCILPIRVVQPIAVTSRCSPSPSPPPYSSNVTDSDGNPDADSGAGGGGFLGLDRCLISLEVRNDHPTATVTLHDVEAHVDGTARSGDKASQRFVAPGNNSAGGRHRRRGESGVGGSDGGGGGSGVVSSFAPMEGLEGSIEQAPTGPGRARNFSRLFCASWVAKPTLPLKLAPGEVQGFVLALAPDAAVEPLLPRRADGHFETPVTFVWTLENADSSTGADNDAKTSAFRLSPSPSPRPAAAAAAIQTALRPTTSVHLAQWRAEQRARDEVLVRVRGQPRVKLNNVFEVSLVVRNLSGGARDLVVMFTEDAADASRTGRVKPTLGEGGRSGALGRSREVMADDEADDDANNEEEALDSVSPLPSPARFRAIGGSGHLAPISPATGPNSAVIYNNNSGGGGGGKNAPGGAIPASHSHPKQYHQHVKFAATWFGEALLPLDAAVPLGRLEKGAECGTTVRLTAARTGLARLSTLCLRDTLTGSVYAPACPYEVFVE